MTAATAIDMDSLYSAHSGWLRGWLRRYTRCPDRADDLAQDTFCKLIESPAVAPVRDSRSYLATVARHLLVDDIRHREVERAYLALHAVRTGEVDHLTPDRFAEAAQLLGAILRLIETLPEKARRAFLMVRFDGVRYAIAAEQLGVSERMVKRYVAQVYAHCYALAYPD